MKLLCIVSGIFDATPGKGEIMNEMRLYTGLLNGVTALFVPNLCSEQYNKVNGAMAPPTKNVCYWSIIFQLQLNYNYIY